jgi:hypothetical protein
MSRIYLIISVAGWAWFVIAAIYLFFRRNDLFSKTPPRGMGVSPMHAVSERQNTSHYTPPGSERHMHGQDAHATGDVESDNP